MNKEEGFTEILEILQNFQNITENPKHLGSKKQKSFCKDNFKKIIFVFYTQKNPLIISTNFQFYLS